MPDWLFLLLAVIVCLAIAWPLAEWAVSRRKRG